MPKAKARQEELPGMEARDVPEIEQAAENYRKIRDERCELSKRESEAKAALIQVLKNLGRSFYQYNGLRVQLEITDNVKVRAEDSGDEEPTGTFTQPTRRKRKAQEIAEDWIEQAEELIEQQQASKDDKCVCGHIRDWHDGQGGCCMGCLKGECNEFRLNEEAERERLHREALATWRRERPASSESEEVETETDEDRASYWAKWRDSLNDEDQHKYYAAQCSCGHTRDWHINGADEETDCAACPCEGYHCPKCGAKGGHQATCEHYVLGEGTPVQSEAENETWVIPPTINQALHAALHHVESAAERWRPLQEKGATDDELKAMIGREFGIAGGSTDYEGYRYKGGKSPEFSWPGYADQSNARTLKGKGLLAKVREVMGIGAPGQTDDFTAPRCDICGRIDGAHTKECPRSGALTFEDYLMFVQAHYKGNHKSYARKMELRRDPEMDAKVKQWIHQKAVEMNEAEEAASDQGEPEGISSHWTPAPISDENEKAEMRKENAKRIEKRIKNAHRKNLRAV